ncbi:molybdenum cofactor guanylyltransferase [Parahaliea sp. F7430]|uniref:Molybdenum cofactor guanylyltransferase n=1 Tax=Sediminihaliea albiluteola TaxID=2758564 RepID=A0A7W2TV43_9GAMM|nr:molybdenum cofactor guanylyltransferase MobA [Sediminihaliea albiluteola]MBA6412527.1 molybdenum cofactor guanylyltransferase [Sediminihaliea albiluteola]
MTVALHDRRAYTGLVLAGGAGRRVGGQDKGMLSWRGAKLAEHVCYRLRPQVGELWISCNRNQQFYGSLADRVVVDQGPGFEGPLAGIAAVAALTADIQSPFLLISACDTPRLPVDLGERLMAGLQDPAIDVCVAFDGEREQYLAAALRTRCLPSVNHYLELGQRSVRGWYASLRRNRIDFSDQAESFFNYNNLTQ